MPTAASRPWLTPVREIISGTWKSSFAVVRALKGTGGYGIGEDQGRFSDDYRLLAGKLWEAGADILHVDLMDFGNAKLRYI